MDEPTVSFGKGVSKRSIVCGVPVDQVASAASLLDLAGQRMREAMQSGGNRTESGGAAAATRTISLHHALELVTANRGQAVLPHLDALGIQLLPLLQLMDQELGLALPLAEIERRLNERATKK